MVLTLVPRYVLNLLGTWQVQANGTSVTHFRGEKVRALLAYLAVESDRPHARARLAGLLWPELPDDLAGRNLSQALVRLRTALGVRPGMDGDPLWATRQDVQWRPELGFVDVTEFSRLSISTERGDLERAAALYRGEFLAGFGLRDSEAFEEWLLVTRERLKEVALGVLHVLAERALGAGRAIDAVATARRQLRLDPWRETAHRQLMQALATTGDRAGALAAYARCCAVLRAELDAAPDEETRRLAARIEAGDVTQGASAPASSSAASDTRNLPAPLTALVGREGELARLAELLDGGTRLVTVVGAGGVGKTRLALAAAWALRSRSPDRVWWVALAGLQPGQDPVLERATIADAIAAALDLTFTGRQAPLEELAALGGSASMLTLDGCEHLPEVTEVVRSLLQAAPQVRILATSRAPLGLEGETLLPLQGLPVPAGEEAQPARYAGVQLFLQRAARLTPGWGQEPAQLAGAVRLCRLLEGLPLGIELAAQWVGHYDPDEIGAGLQADLAFLRSRSLDVPDRQRSLRAAFAYAWQLLSVEEQRGLARVSVFRGSFDRPSAQAVAGVRSTTLVALADKSLVEQAGVGHYRLHELLRQFAAERLAERGETEALRDRHLAHYLALAEQAAPELIGPHQAVWMARLEHDRDDLRAALGWAREHEQPEVELRLAGALARFWLNRGYAREGREWLEGALARADAGTAPAAVRARACHGTGRLANIQGAQDQAVYWLEQAISLYREVGDPVSAVRALNTLGGVEYDQGNLARAAELWQECLLLAREAGDPGETAWALGNLGESRYHQGDIEGAAACHKEALKLAQQAGRADIEALQLGCLGNVARRQGDLAGATELLQEALARMQRLGDRRRVAITLENLAQLAAAENQMQRAARLLGAADALRLEIGTPQPVPERIAADQARAIAETTLGSAGFETAFAAGRALPLEETLAGLPQPADAHSADRPPQIQASASGGGGVLRIGLPVSVSSLVLNRVIDAFQAEHPQHSVEVQEVDLRDLYGPLRRRQIDVLVHWTVVDEPDLTVGPTLERRPRVLAVGVGHRLARREGISIEDLADEQIDPGLHPPALLDAFVPDTTPSGRPIRRGEPAGTVQGTIYSVALGRVVHPTMTGVSTLIRPDIVLVPIRDLPPMPLGLIWCAAREDPRIRALAELARSLTDAPHPHETWPADPVAPLAPA